MPGRGREPGPALRRAAFFGAGLLLLWLLLQLGSGPSPEPVADDAAGTVATNPAMALPRHDGPRLFSFGNVLAILLLAGGGAFALYLRRRTAGGGGRGALFETLGQMSLAPNQQLRLVAFGDEVLLLGVTAGQITLLKSYPRHVVDALAQEAVTDDDPGQAESAPVPARTAVPVSFATLLRQHAAAPGAGTTREGSW